MSVVYVVVMVSLVLIVQVFHMVCLLKMNVAYVMLTIRMIVLKIVQVPGVAMLLKMNVEYVMAIIQVVLIVMVSYLEQRMSMVAVIALKELQD